MKKKLRSVSVLLKMSMTSFFLQRYKRCWLISESDAFTYHFIV